MSRKIIGFRLPQSVSDKLDARAKINKVSSSVMAKKMIVDILRKDK